MTSITSNPSRWAHLSECPRILRDSRRSGWNGFEFVEIEVSEAGEYVARDYKDLLLFQTCGPMKMRKGGGAPTGGAGLAVSVGFTCTSPSIRWSD